MRKSHSLHKIFAVPLTLAVMSVAGLVIALTGDGWRDAAAWAALGIPVLAVGWAIKVKRR